MKTKNKIKEKSENKNKRKPSLSFITLTKDYFYIIHHTLYLSLKKSESKN